MTHEWCAEGIHSQFEYFAKLPLSVFPWTAKQLFEGKYVATNSLDEYPPEAEQERLICVGEKIKSIIFVPIISYGNVIGATALDVLSVPCKWSGIIIKTLKILSTLFASCIEKRRTEIELEEVTRKECYKLGVDLHDSLGQDITAISFLSSALGKTLQKIDPKLAEQSLAIREQTGIALNNIRNITRGLKSFDPTGHPVPDILRKMAEDTEKSTGVKCEFIDGNIPQIEDPETSLQLIWIAREATNNAVRHGKASHIKIILEEYGDKLSLTVQDDGIGLAPDFTEKAGIGLKVMRYRAAAMGGRVTINLGDESGVRVRCVFPR